MGNSKTRQTKSINLPANEEAMDTSTLSEDSSKHSIMSLILSTHSHILVKQTGHGEKLCEVEWHLKK